MGFSRMGPLSSSMSKSTPKAESGVRMSLALQHSERSVALCKPVQLDEANSIRAVVVTMVTIVCQIMPNCSRPIASHSRDQQWVPGDPIVPTVD
eukprot:1311976-Pyramimonas_sp.AAC.1